MDRDGNLYHAWWHDQVDYRWLVEILASHAALGPLKRFSGAGGAAMCIIAILCTFTPAGPHHLTGRAVDWAIAAVGAVWAFRWWSLPWPGEVESLTLYAIIDVAVTVACLQASNEVYRAIGLIPLVIAGSYITFFHSAKVLAVHASWSLMSVLVLSIPILFHDVCLGLAIILVMVATTVLMLPALQFRYWLLRTDVLSDPLTTLPNRRGLEYYSTTFLDSARPTPVCVMSIDLDKFKAINDTFGHQAGDGVLTTTAARLRSAVAPDAIVARVGGEEFAIAGHMTKETASAAAERVRYAVADTNGGIPVTASIGVVVVDACAIGTRRRVVPAIEDLLHRADLAMYCAKKGGGNAVVLDQPTTARAGDTVRTGRS